MPSLWGTAGYGKPTNIEADIRRRRKVARQLKAASAPALADFDRAYKPGERIPESDFARVVQTVGGGQLPGRTYAQIARGESNLNPNADRELTHPNDPGKGILQMTGNVQTRGTNRAWDQIASEHEGGYFNPVANARMALHLAGSGDGLNNFYGDRYVTDRNAHAKPFPERKPVTPELKQRAQNVLGKKRTKRIMQGPKPQLTPRQTVIRNIPEGFRDEGRHDERTPEENRRVGGSATSDHLTTNPGSYAADLPFDEELALELAENIGLDNHTGTNEIVDENGFRHQLIYKDKGHFDHIHYGVSDTGAPATAPSHSPGSGGGGGGGGGIGAPSGGVADVFGGMTQMTPIDSDLVAGALTPEEAALLAEEERLERDELLTDEELLAQLLAG